MIIKRFWQPSFLHHLKKHFSGGPTLVNFYMLKSTLTPTRINWKTFCSNFLGLKEHFHILTWLLQQCSATALRVIEHKHIEHYAYEHSISCTVRVQLIQFYYSL